MEKVFEMRTTCGTVFKVSHYEDYWHVEHPQGRIRFTGSEPQLRMKVRHIMLMMKKKPLSKAKSP